MLIIFLAVLYTYLFFFLQLSTKKNLTKKRSAHFDTINCLLSSVLCALCSVNAMNDRPSTLLTSNCICVAIKISMLFHVRLWVIQIEKENAFNTSTSSSLSLLFSSLSYNNRKIKRKLTVLISHIHTIVLSRETSSLFPLLLLFFVRIDLSVYTFDNSFEKFVETRMDFVLYVNMIV